MISSTLQTKSHKPKLGLFASSTPFVTGRPYTLLFNGSVKSSGAVGFALSGGSCPVAETAFPGLCAITAPLKVTQYVLPPITGQSLLLYHKSKSRSEGNLINELDNANPTALLVAAIEKSALTGTAARDDEFYLGVLRDGGELWQLHHILAGGPSRGTMALDTETAPGEGTSVQVCRAINSFFGPHFERIHIAFSPSNDKQSRYRCGSPAEEYSRIRCFATGTACRGRGRGCQGARGYFCCCEREWVHVETRRRGDMDVHRTWCTGAPYLVSA